jgi:hypothetical protein
MLLAVTTWGGTATAGSTRAGAHTQHTIAALNAYRAQNGAGPLTFDPCISRFSHSGSAELLRDGTWHAHFAADAPGSCNVMAENQAEYPVIISGRGKAALGAAINRAIDQALADMMAEGPGGGHHDNMLNPTYTRVGVGLVRRDGMLYLTTDFGP